MQTQLAEIIEGILFYEGDSVSLAELISFTGEDEDSIRLALKEIEEKYKNKNSINFLAHGNSYSLFVSGTARDLILAKDAKEREGELTRPAMETLATVIYLDSATKNQIDYIRGVQSSYMLRTLLSRGLVQRSGKIGRDVSYSPTIETLRFLGINSVNEMPDYEKVSSELKTALQINQND